VCNINCRIIKKKVSFGLNICGAWARTMRVETKGTEVKLTWIMQYYSTSLSNVVFWKQIQECITIKAVHNLVFSW